MNINQAVQRHLDIDAKIRALTTEKKALKEAIVSEMEDQKTNFFVGTDDDHGLKLVEAIRMTLDTKAAKEELGEEWVDAHSKAALVVSLKLSRGDA
tara:strand:+ start:127 stop:414 length:288 start_codon:yes stop_codon:yes gene_type:complete